MANSGLNPSSIQSAVKKLPGAVAPKMKGAATVAGEVAKARASNKNAISIEAGRRLWKVITATVGQKRKLIAAFLKNAPEKLIAVAKKHGVAAVGRHFGFSSDKAFLEYMAERIEAMKKRDASDVEFLGGALGRQNAFLGALLELCIKYGPLRKIVLELTDDARNVTNAEIAARAATSAPYRMRNANNGAVAVTQKFSAPLMANLMEIDTPDGPKASVDFAGVSFNASGQWTLPLPIEIKLPRAASGVGAQFAALAERLSAAIGDKKKVFAYFDVADLSELEKRVGKAAIVGTEIRDGREMAKVMLDPKNALFNSDEVFGSLRRNQMLVRPDSRFWNPADPAKIPAASAQPIFSIATINGRPVSVEMSASSAGSGRDGGFNFWRVLVPVKRSFLVDVYSALFGADK